LDEIGDLKPELQAKLLRVLQEREFERVGGTQSIRIDVRMIAATNQDIDRAVQEGRFREDLFFRLNVVTINLPPLRDRKEDVPLLTQHFLHRSCQEMKRPFMKISEAARHHLMNYHWPGNVRELANLIERAVVLAKADTIEPEDLPLRAPILPRNDQDLQEWPYHEAVQFYRKKVILRALEKAEGHQAKAAELLGLQRTYLARLIKKLKIR
jgi:Nif-specific regulatory protein